VITIAEKAAFLMGVGMTGTLGGRGPVGEAPIICALKVPSSDSSNSPKQMLRSRIIPSLSQLLKSKLSLPGQTAMQLYLTDAAVEEKDGPKYSIVATKAQL
jgi:hypothetical protein